MERGTGGGERMDKGGEGEGAHNEGEDGAHRGKFAHLLRPAKVAKVT